MQPVYINATAQCLPGPPIGNREMVDYIGRLSPEAERFGRLTLRQNRIRHRHYAIRPDGSSDWTVARLAGRAVRDLVAGAEVDADEIGFLATATTQNDLLVPGSPAASMPRRAEADGGGKPAKRLREFDHGVEGGRPAGRGRRA